MVEPTSEGPVKFPPKVLYEHPGSTGWSVRSHPSVLATSSEFALLLVVTCVAFVLLIIPFLTTIVYATFMYPRFVANPSDQRKLLAFRFLFFRYNPNRHYYGALAITKSLALCMVPVLVQDEPAMQMIVISAIIQGSLVFQALTCPWKSRLTNIFDGVVSAGLELILICAALSTDISVDEELLSIMGVVSICFIFSAIVVALGISVYQRLLPSPRYDFFVCHHKVDASAQSRLLKCMMTAGKGGCLTTAVFSAGSLANCGAHFVLTEVPGLLASSRFSACRTRSCHFLWCHIIHCHTPSHVLSCPVM